jgi:beta-lactamase class A
MNAPGCRKPAQAEGPWAEPVAARACTSGAPPIVAASTEDLAGHISPVRFRGRIHGMVLNALPARAVRALACGLLLASPTLAQTNAGSVPSADVTAGAEALRAGLERRLENIAARLDGDMGYCVVDLTTGARIARKADEAFPTASTIKIAVLYELFAQADEKRLRLDDVRPLPASARVGGSGILHELASPALTLADYATLMIVLSDNSATNLLIDAVGMDNVNQRMRGLGLQRIWLQRRMIDLEAARQGRENLASPCDVAALLDHVQRGTGLSAGSRDAMLAIHRKPKSTPITRAVPAGVPVASKPGGLDGVTVDAGFVAQPGRPYIVVGMTNWLVKSSDGDEAVEALARETHAYFSRLARGGKYGRMIE